MTVLGDLLISDRKSVSYNNTIIKHKPTSYPWFCYRDSVTAIRGDDITIDHLSDI